MNGYSMLVTKYNPKGSKNCSLLKVLGLALPKPSPELI
jgi:hypothetical protein